MTEEVFFDGEVQKVIYSNPSNFYKVVALKISKTNATDYTKSKITVTGECADIVEGEEYRFYGELVDNSYGLQLKISRYDRKRINKEGLIHYLSSRNFTGIGRKKAEIIQSLYEGSDDIVEAILNDPSKIQTIKGLSKENKENFLNRLESDRKSESILSQLFELGVPHLISLKIQEKYKEEAVDKIKENPYALVRDIKGFSFAMADVVASHLGIREDSPQRISAGILHVLSEKCNRTGDTYVDRPELIDGTVNLLEKSAHVNNIRDVVVSELNSLIGDKEILTIDDKMFIPSYYKAEEKICRNIKRLLGNSKYPLHLRGDIEFYIDRFEKEINRKYDNIQRSAIIQALENPVFILTGGPGTGKTTVIQGIIDVYSKIYGLNIKSDDEDSSILIAAPTGRAARRVSELTSLPSKTLHRHLGLPDNYREDDLDASLIIVDEFSMVDTWLGNKFFDRISSRSQVIIVGDAGQLPSVSPGNVLGDLLEVPSVPSVKLENVYRQSDDSTIVSLSADIRKGIVSKDFTAKKADRSFLERDKTQVVEAVGKILQSAQKSGIDAKDIQILAPMYKGEAGINALNVVVQELLNPAKEGEIEFKSYSQTYRVGDKVIHLENKPENNVFNGDLGYITKLIPAHESESGKNEIVMRFDQSEDAKDVVYEQQDWDLISLAYAMSIHKSQGSEFPVVIIPITYGAYNMLQRNLIYTGVTRAKQKLVLLGELGAFKHAIEKVALNRKTWLAQRFAEK